jgi:hypothetical protein
LTPVRELVTSRPLLRLGEGGEFGQDHAVLANEAREFAGAGVVHRGLEAVAIGFEAGHAVIGHGRPLG